MLPHEDIDLKFKWRYSILLEKISFMLSFKTDTTRELFSISTGWGHEPCLLSPYSPLPHLPKRWYVSPLHTCWLFLIWADTEQRPCFFSHQLRQTMRGKTGGKELVVLHIYFCQRGRQAGRQAGMSMCGSAASDWCEITVTAAHSVTTNPHTDFASGWGSRVQPQLR